MSESAIRLFDPEELGGDGFSGSGSEVTRRWGVRGGSRRDWGTGCWRACGGSSDIEAVVRGTGRGTESRYEREVR